MEDSEERWTGDGPVPMEESTPLKLTYPGTDASEEEDESQLSQLTPLKITSKQLLQLCEERSLALTTQQSTINSLEYPVVNLKMKEMENPVNWRSVARPQVPTIGKWEGPEICQIFLPDEELPALLPKLT